MEVLEWIFAALGITITIGVLVVVVFLIIFLNSSDNPFR